MTETTHAISPRVVEYVTLINLFQGVLLLFLLFLLLLFLYTGRLHGRAWCDERTERVVSDAFMRMPISWKGTINSLD